MNVNPLENKNRNPPPPPPPFISQSPRSGCFFFISNFLYLKITDNAQLCTGKIRIIPSSNIENRP